MATQPRARRVSVSADVVFRAENAHFIAKTANLSETGLFLLTQATLAPGTPLHLVFGMPPTLPRISSEGIVKWSKDREGVGVELTALSPEHREALRQFLDSSHS